MAAAAMSRNRYDSGYEEDVPLVEEEDDLKAEKWNATINDWSYKAHSIVTQEVIRMRAMTEARTKADDANAAWREDMREMMETTVDLIQCVANDIVETNTPSLHPGSGESCSSSSMTSQDLGKIIEEELFDGGDQNKPSTVLLVRTKKHSRKRKRRNSKRWEAKKSFTIRVDEIHKKDEEEKVPWSKETASPVAWDYIENDVEEEAEQPEDIYRDWMRMLRRTSSFSADADDRDINDVFWSISLGPRRRQRRMSEVLENLPFQDQPDIFEDRCEILETTSNKISELKERKKTPTGGRKKQPKCYWNIFDEWKKIFKEPKKRKNRNKKRSKNSMKRRYGRRNRKAFGGAQLKYIYEAEDIFHDFLHAFKEKENNKRAAEQRGRRRSREEVDDDSHAAENVSKRLKTSKNWEIIRAESSRTFDLITRNIEQKIREAFMQETNKTRKSREKKEAATDNNLKMEQSRREFIRLREEVRRMRKEAKRRRTEGSEYFDEWRWNLDGGEDETRPKPHHVVSVQKMKIAPSSALVKYHKKSLMAPRLPRESVQAKARRRMEVKLRATQPRVRGNYTG